MLSKIEKYLLESFPAELVGWIMGRAKDKESPADYVVDVFTVLAVNNSHIDLEKIKKDLKKITKKDE